MRRYTTILIAVLALLALAATLFSADAAVAAKSEATLTGSVVNSSGKPVGNAKVSITPDQAEPNARMPEAKSVTTDKAGRFHCKVKLDPEHPSASFSVLADGYCMSNQQVEVKEGTPVIITLYPSYTLRGKVVDESGRPLARARVTVTKCEAYSVSPKVWPLKIDLPEKSKSVTTGKDGVFGLKGVRRPDDFAGIHVDLTISAPGHALIHKGVLSRAASDVVKVTDPPECKLTGTLYLPGKSGVAPEKTLLKIEVPSDSGSDVRCAEVGKDGKFSIAQLPPVNVNVVLGERRNAEKSEPPPWMLPAVMGVPLSPKQPKNLELVMVRGALIKGSIIDKATGKGLASAALSISHPGKPGGDNAVTDDQGEFSARVVAGEATVSVARVDVKDRQINFRDRPAATITVADGEEKTDFALEVDLTSEDIYEVGDKPILPGLEIAPGTYDLTWDVGLDCSADVYLSARHEGDAVDSHLKKLPKLQSTRAQRMAFGFDGSGDDGLLFVVVDESEGTGKGWDTIYLDVNRNGDLTDDEPIHFKLGKRTGWIAVQAHQGTQDNRTDNPMQVRLATRGDSSSVNVDLARTGGWRGTVDSNNGKLDCAAVDANSDGIYGEPWSVVADSADLIYINNNGFRRLVATGAHGTVLYDVTKIGDRFYDLTVSPIGSKLTVKPYAGPMGQLLVRGRNIRGLNATARSLVVATERGHYCFENCGDKPVTLPAGKCSIVSCDMIFDTPRQLHMTCSLNGPFEVSPDKESIATVGGPFSLGVSPSVNDLVLQAGHRETVDWDIRIGGTTKVGLLFDPDTTNALKVSFLKSGKLLYTTAARFT